MPKEALPPRDPCKQESQLPPQETLPIQPLPLRQAKGFALPLRGRPRAGAVTREGIPGPRNPWEPGLGRLTDCPTCALLVASLSQNGFRFLLCKGHWATGCPTLLHQTFCHWVWADAQATQHVWARGLTLAAVAVFRESGSISLGGYWVVFFLPMCCCFCV